MSHPRGNPGLSSHQLAEVQAFSLNFIIINSLSHIGNWKGLLWYFLYTYTVILEKQVIDISIRLAKTDIMNDFQRCILVI